MFLLSSLTCRAMAQVSSGRHINAELPKIIRYFQSAKKCFYTVFITLNLVIIGGLVGIFVCTLILKTADIF